MSETIEEISELEQLVKDEKPEPPPDNSPLKHSKLAFVGGILLIDAVTSYTIWMITSYWYYGVIWFFVGAVAFFLHLQNWERAGNNDKQEHGAMRGIMIAVGAMLVMGVYAGVIFITKTITTLSEALVVGSSIVLFFYHVYQLAHYYFSDDDWIISRQIANADANSNKRIKIITAGERIVTAAETARDLRKKAVHKHGDAGAVDAAINRAGGNHKQQHQQFRPTPAASLQMAIDGKTERLAERPTPRPMPSAQPRQYTLAQFLVAIDQTADSARGMLKQYSLNDANSAWSSLKQYHVLPTDLTRENFSQLYDELMEQETSPNGYRGGSR
jgi:hypothetical protein